MAAKKQIYSGNLNTYLSRNLDGRLAPNATWAQCEDAIFAEIERRLPRLFAHYGINRNDPDKWATLAMQLACDHVKGFQFRPTRKRTRFGPDAKAARRELLDLVEKEAHRTLSKSARCDTAICKRLAKNPSVLPEYYRKRKSPHNTLRSELTLARKERQEAMIREMSKSTAATHLRDVVAD